MPATTPLGEYLRARRELVRPEDVGLTRLGRRRVPGLRREELATIAGISSDYYLRLEQGRDQHPSVPVIEALARALRLDEDATAHLYSLANPLAPRHRPEDCERAPASIERLIASLPHTPAFAHGRLMDVLAANALASALSPIFSQGVNLVQAVFLDPGVRKLWRDWGALAESTVARLRVLVGPDVEDPRLRELVGDLSARSDEFRHLWARHDILVPAARSTVFDHPLVGTLELQPERLAILGAAGQLLIICHAEPGSPSERALIRLAELTVANSGHRA
ncbi:MAG TPA: helix-turn-helix transcriptional regulator [Gemmatimonadaceae bacterium]|jgi:transcriptional regulator with XRE-family HTH domain